MMRYVTPPKVFLSGRLESNWQDKVIAEVRNVEFYDPRSHELQSPNQYAIWDTHHVRRADILFAYMEKDNPSGYGLAIEIGYARSLGKTVILVDERSQVDEQFRRYFAIVREMSDVVLDSLEEGIALLKRFVRGGVY
jgi:nucleoside 2-deoxyribosyltransferase